MLTAKTKILCIIGHPIDHSLSVIMHNAAIQKIELDYRYIAFNVFPNDLSNAIDGLKSLNIKGASITIPHKISVMKYLDIIEPMAEMIGAINTIKNEDGILIGRNTDGEGFLKSVKESGYNIKNKKVVLFGAGGAARACAFYLAKEVDKITIINRSDARMNDLISKLNSNYSISIKGINLSKKEEIKKEIADSDMLVNTTPVGMYPKVNVSPVNPLWLHPNLFVVDLIYSPIHTKLLQDASSIGCNVLSGVGMLINQGIIAFEWWTGFSPDKKLMKQVVIAELEKLK
ncbi:shikimate dehydrogenase [Promethearchaeum syntrophicum]|uniref:Shikimate dehydrogenase (NADP(+)) n=1 Tax=Promethearchaeum syntrophicum TaxID=2594042 RepID=A0A5B9D8E9_9ARCH|nr:shikimate dehydrogenase [Candidatus Prometheoarchaeum syntrophicum]QEE15439.1 Shikimate dehydrogenase [Candidatus Prometheoarchaeum syntrophicum]